MCHATTNTRTQWKFCGLLFQWLWPSKSLSLFMLHSAISCVQQSTHTNTHSGQSRSKEEDSRVIRMCRTNFGPNIKKTLCIYLYVEKTCIPLYTDDRPSQIHSDWSESIFEWAQLHKNIFTNLTLAMRNFSQSFRVHFTTVCVCLVFFLAHCCESECDV